MTGHESDTPYEVEVTVKWTVETWMVDYYNWMYRDSIEQMGTFDAESLVLSWIENMACNACDSARDDGWTVHETGDGGWTATPPPEAT